MKADYQVFRKLKFGESGLGWNESTWTTEATSTWSAGKIQENSKYEKFENKDLSLYMRYYDTLFGDIVATSEREKAANTYSAVNLEEGHEFTEVLGEDDDGKEGSGDSDDNNTQATPSLFQSSSLRSGRSSGSKRKQSGADRFCASLDGLVAQMSCRSTLSTAATTEEASIKEAVDLLDAMEQVQCGTDLCFYARRYLLDKGNRILFLKARNDEVRYGELMYNFTRAGRHQGGQ